MPIIVSPRSRYIRSYDTSDGTVRVQLPQVNTQKLSSTTRPRSSASRSGWSALSQLVLVSSGAVLSPPGGADGGATGRRRAALVAAPAPVRSAAAAARDQGKRIGYSIDHDCCVELRSQEIRPRRAPWIRGAPCVALPDFASRHALERPDELGRDPPSVVQPRLRLDMVLADPARIHASGVEGHVILNHLVTRRRRAIAPSGIFRPPTRRRDGPVAGDAFPLAKRRAVAALEAAQS